MIFSQTVTVIYHIVKTKVPDTPWKTILWPLFYSECYILKSYGKYRTPSSILNTAITGIPIDGDSLRGRNICSLCRVYMYERLWLCTDECKTTGRQGQLISNIMGLTAAIECLWGSTGRRFNNVNEVNIQYNHACSDDQY